MNKIAILMLIVGYLLSCNYNKIDERPKNDFSSLKGFSDDKFSKNWEKIYFQEIFQKIESIGIVQLQNLELKKNDEEIRIWVGFDSSPLRGIILKRNSDGESAIYIPPIKSTSTININTLEKLKPPISNWQSLWNKLEGLNIKELPDPMDISEMDGKSVVIEIKTFDGYKNYKYSNIGKNNEVNYQKVKQICETLSNEFLVDLLIYNSKS